MHALLATGVNGDGHREILGLQVTSAEDGAGWLGFFRDLTARGLTGVKLVTSDAHNGLVAAIGAALPAQRGACGTPDEPLLRYRSGQPITARRYDHLWQRLGRHLAWVRTQQISTHWLRHTTLTWVERNFGYAVARAYAGHNGSRDAAVTSTYVRADITEIAAALAALTGEPHPLAPTPVERRRGPLVAPGPG
ncbi:hypothetical protein GCM10009559_60560 [Pseudonocardia zijingensis]|uniref:Mutator family transposase n=1 Tax=Pseudonocardia zijingensis TaxID=153376 RepID=A0ABP3YRH2_9PSEU